ncbi:plasma-membrane proton-efflux P-type ATPase [Alicyclobacillaceae bacterium I2511]|nr:plasma-membrane proton-efflux P-type ATPase [Alicyclobacillaceae bacterium I2511]
MENQSRVQPDRQTEGQNLTGLTTAQVAQLHQQYGYNEVAEVKPHPVLHFLRKFWAPVPWMLESTIILSLWLGKNVDAVVIAFLLVFNAIVSVLQESRADKALALLREKLMIEARVLRDGEWARIPSRELVPGDVIHVRMGDSMPADVSLMQGALVLDQSPLTGESVPVDKGLGDTAYAGALVKHGEATGQVAATGTQTYFGRTSELVKQAVTGSHLERTILGIVRNLVVIDVLLVLVILTDASLTHVPLLTMLPFALILIVASVPVALPATFTLAQTLGARELAEKGALVSRLSAIQEAASMDVLCTDKTGTITLNQLSVANMQAYAPYTLADVLRYASWASDASTQDSIDLAVLEKKVQTAQTAQAGNLSQSETVNEAKIINFTPFEPATKRTEAVVEYQGKTYTVMKGAPQTLAELAPHTDVKTVSSDVDNLAASGYRVIGVGVQEAGQTALRFVGLIALQDPPRPDSLKLVQALHQLGIRLRMLTGDTVQTARAIAQQVGISGKVCDAAVLAQGSAQEVADCDVVAGIFPEDKFHLVESLQKSGAIVGMTGDGVNDAPSLKQAEVGIAVANATDVAKAAASIVLTTPGLMGIVTAVETSRRIYRRMQTYTVNKITKTIQVALFLSIGFLVTRHFVVTPSLIVLLLFANDFVTMSIATDRVSFSQRPVHWHVSQLVRSSMVLALALLVESFLVLYGAHNLLLLTWSQVQTAVFLMLVFSGQTTIYVIRGQRHFWDSAPSRPLWMASVADIILVSVMASLGILMAPIPVYVTVAILGMALVFMVLMDGLRKWAGMNAEDVSQESEASAQAMHHNRLSDEKSSS